MDIVGLCFGKSPTAIPNFVSGRWPKTHPDRQRLNWIHTILRSVAEAGINFIPTPIVANSGESIVEHNGYFFELAPWLDGKATYESEPCHEKLDFCDDWIGQVPSGDSSIIDSIVSPSGPAKSEQPAPAVKSNFKKNCHKYDWPWRLNRIRGFASIAKLGKTLCDNFELLSGLIERQLSHSMQLSVMVQPVIRDVWHDHMLFDENRLSGIVGFWSDETWTQSRRIFHGYVEVFWEMTVTVGRRL